MKQITAILAIGALVACLASCSKVDDYTAPDATLTGNIIDSVTGQPLRTEQPNGVRLRMLETSWSQNPIPWYFWVKGDGTFNNTKVFGATYEITPVDGPFYPIAGKSVQVTGTTRIDFTVVPFLTVNISKVTQADTTVTLSYNIARPRTGFKITDAKIFVSTTPYVSNSSFILNLTQTNDLNSVADATILGTTYSTTVTGLGRKRTYYIRVGARSDDNVSKRYNYSEVKQIDIP